MNCKFKEHIQNKTFVGLGVNEASSIVNIVEQRRARTTYILHLFL